MANPITWRNVDKANQSDALRFNQLGSQQISGGLSGLSGIAKSISSDMSADELNEALSSIGSLGSVDAARQAQNNDFIKNLGLNTEQTNKARSALDTRLNSLMISSNAANTFDDNTLNREEAPIINQLNQSLANSDFDSALKLSEGLKDSGKFVKQINDQRTVFDTKAKSEQEALNLKTFQEDLVNAGGSGNSFYDQARIGALNAPNLTAAQRPQALQFIDLMRNNDPSVRDENLAIEKANKEALVQQNIGDQRADLDLNSFIADNPVDAALTPQEGLTTSDVFTGFEKYAQTANGTFNWGRGDFKSFKESANKAINKQWTDSEGKSKQFNPVVIKEALTNSPEVAEAVVEGNLGDWGDNINSDDFYDLLNLYQARYNKNLGIKDAIKVRKDQNILNKQGR